MTFLTRQDDKILLGGHHIDRLLSKYGSPLYVYSEELLRQNCRKLNDFFNGPDKMIKYAVKANTNISILRIIHSEGIGAEVMSIGEIHSARAAGYTPSEMLFVSNNVSPDKFENVNRFGLQSCLDSVPQIKDYAEHGGTKDIYIRINPGQGDGHHEKVITAGKVKFGIEPSAIDEAFETAAAHGLKITGFCMHIGSLFREWKNFHEAVLTLLNFAEKYPEINYVDFGGGFGTPYIHATEKDFPYSDYKDLFAGTLEDWRKKHQRNVTFAIQPGRALVANTGFCLTRVISDKVNFGHRFLGTDLGLNFLVRPAMYGSYHEIENGSATGDELEELTITGNICESGDILAENRPFLKKTKIGDSILVHDTGAYGYSMSGNYNSMPRPAEVMIDSNGHEHIIRYGETIDDLLRHQVY